MTIFLQQPQEGPTQEELEQIEKERQKQEATEAFATVLGFFVKPLIIMFLWNMLLPGLFGAATIGYFKSLGLYTLVQLFK